MGQMVFIPHNVPSLKDGKNVYGGNLVHSEHVRKYLQKIGIRSYSCLQRKKFVKGYQNQKKRPNLFAQSMEPIREEIWGMRERPVLMGFHFVRESKRRFDFSNAVEIIQDLMVAHKIIEDDSLRYLAPFPMRIGSKFYTVDPAAPGVFIKIYRLSFKNS